MAFQTYCLDSSQFHFNLNIIITCSLRVALFQLSVLSILEFFVIRSGGTRHSVDLILLLLRWLFIQLVAVLYDALFDRRYVYHCHLRAILMYAICRCRTAIHAGLSRAKRCRGRFGMISVLLQLLTCTIQLLALVIWEKRDLLCFLTEWTLRLWNLLSSHFVRRRKRILMTLTWGHELFEDLGRTTGCLLHHERVFHIEFLVTATLKALFATSALFVALIRSHVTQLSLHEHFILNVLVFIKNLFVATHAWVALLTRLLSAQFFVHLHQTLYRLLRVCKLLTQLFATLR